MERTEIEQKLLEYPGKIFTKRTELDALMYQRNLAEQKIKEVEASVKHSVGQDKLLTNQLMRDTEVARQLLMHETYQDRRNALDELTNRIAFEQAHLECLHNQFRSYLAVAGMQPNYWSLHQNPEAKP